MARICCEQKPNPTLYVDLTLTLNPNFATQIPVSGQQPVAAAVQTGRSLDKKLVELPEIATLGTYEASIRLHPEVSGVFKLVIVKDKTGL